MKGLSDRQFYRSGLDHRQGHDVTFGDVRARFDFRSIEIGQWVTRSERDHAAGLFFDALCDLMHILQGPESLISLRSTLSIAYGTGGKPGVSAHYQPSNQTFSLAKNAGPGSMAHEWFHALDHYLGQKAFQNVSRDVFASRAWLDNQPAVSHPLNDLLFECYRQILLDDSGENPSDMFFASAAMDKQQGVIYFSQPEELCARAFEAFVQDAAIKNHFLVKGTKSSTEAEAGLYPQAAHRIKINHAFNAYFSCLGATLRR